MQTTQLSAESIALAAAAIPENSPFFMLNLLRYREQADYGDGGDAEAVPCSGRDAYYGRYVPAFNHVAASEGVEDVQIFYVGSVMAALVAPSDEKWDDIALVRYPNFEAFRRVSQSPLYAAQAHHHRQAALEDWRLIATNQVILPAPTNEAGTP